VWVKEEREDADLNADPATAKGKLAALYSASDPKQMGTLLRKIKTTTTHASWRFWIRLAIGCLPTNKRLMKMANSPEDNIYRHVYADSLGEHGRCNRCGHDQETAQHAIAECPKAKPRWDRLHSRLEDEWAEAGLDWNKINWLNPELYPGCDPHLARMGVVPRQATDGIPGASIATYKLIASTALQMLETSWETWEERNKHNLEWLESMPDVKARKARADRTSWRFEKKHDGHPRKRKTKQTGSVSERMQRVQEWAHEVDADLKVKVKQQAEQHAMDHDEGRDPLQGLRLHPTEVQRGVQGLREQATRMYNTTVGPIMKKAKMAEGTRDIDDSELTPMSMLDTLPAVNTRSLKWFWVPPVNTMVETFKQGTQGEKLDNLRGTWHPGKVVELGWPEGKGVPGVKVRYIGGDEVWHGMDKTGFLLRPLTKPIGKKGKPYSTMFPETAVAWLGIESRVGVKWDGIGWCDAQVVGTDRHGVILQYDNGTTVAHNDLHTRGCRIKEFRRQRDQTTYYKDRPWLKCPYNGGEDDCECWPCAKTKWPERLAQAQIPSEMWEVAMAVPPWMRTEWIGKNSPLDLVGEAQAQGDKQDPTPDTAGGEGEPKTM
jgi:hypothetical protein